MKKLLRIGLICALLGAFSLAIAQRPGSGPASKSADVEDLVARMMAFDKDGDGKLSRAEMADNRLIRLFDRADADKDGVVTKAELTALGEKEYVADRGFGGPGGPPGGGPGGFGGPGGPGGFGGPMGRPGEILPQMLQQRLKLTDEQKSQVDALQREVDARLMKILTEEQSTLLKEMRSRGPGGPPGGGRRGGPGGPPGGGPPGGGPPGDRPE